MKSLFFLLVLTFSLTSFSQESEEISGEEIIEHFHGVEEDLPVGSFEGNACHLKVLFQRDLSSVTMAIMDENLEIIDTVTYWQAMNYLASTEEGENMARVSFSSFRSVFEITFILDENTGDESTHIRLMNEGREVTECHFDGLWEW